jgi:hypothetical protein
VTLLVVLVGMFCWVGLTVKEFNRTVAQRLLLIITVAVLLDLARGVF